MLYQFCEYCTKEISGERERKREKERGRVIICTSKPVLCGAPTTEHISNLHHFQSKSLFTSPMQSSIFCVNVALLASKGMEHFL